MRIQYLEIVTPELDGVCASYEKAFGVTFSDPVPELGGARTADMPDGGRVGVRGPMRDDETPVVRPYALVDDLEAAMSAAEAAGAEIAIRSMPLPGQGTIGIFILGGIESGVWQR
jgi:predicted enzyme related to lactoylglutathione lyase